MSSPFDLADVSVPRPTIYTHTSGDQRLMWFNISPVSLLPARRVSLSLSAKNPYDAGYK
jgi:hypothetical protein